jgi:hypothetical protein
VGDENQLQGMGIELIAADKEPAILHHNGQANWQTNLFRATS